MKLPGAIHEYRLSEHARGQLKRRQMGEAEVRAVLAAPEQTHLMREGRAVYQSRVGRSRKGRAYLVRVVLDVEQEPPLVMTAYRTSKVAKYWKDES